MKHTVDFNFKNDIIVAVSKIIDKYEYKDFKDVHTFKFWCEMLDYFHAIELEKLEQERKKIEDNDKKRFGTGL